MKFDWFVITLGVLFLLFSGWSIPHFISEENWVFLAISIFNIGIWTRLIVSASRNSAHE